MKKRVSPPSSSPLESTHQETNLLNKPSFWKMMLMEDEGMSFPKFGKCDDSKKVIVNLLLKIRFLNMFIINVVVNNSICFRAQKYNR